MNGYGLLSILGVGLATVTLMKAPSPQAASQSAARAMTLTNVRRLAPGEFVTLQRAVISVGAPDVVTWGDSELPVLHLRNGHAFELNDANYAIVKPVLGLP